MKRQFLTKKTKISIREEKEPAGLKTAMGSTKESATFNSEALKDFDKKMSSYYEFDKDEKRITLFINSGLENNLAEIEIPKNLINGNFTFYLNEQEIFPKVLVNEQISFIVLEFPGSGTHKLDIIGTTYLPEFSDVVPLVLATSLGGIIFLIKKKFS